MCPPHPPGRKLLRHRQLCPHLVWGPHRAGALAPTPPVLLCLPPSQPTPRRQVLCVAGTWGPVLDVREDGGCTWTQGKWSRKAALGEAVVHN